MHDEACSHYVSMVDQTTLGHRFLLSELGYVPRAGWQIDPFGHSSTQAALLSAAVGFDSLFFARIDYEDRRVAGVIVLGWQQSGVDQRPRP
jgi:alpha-mannosidase